MNTWLWIVFFLFFIAAFCLYCTRMPGTSFQDKLPPFTPEERSLARSLESHVRVLATEIGNRSLDNYQNLLDAERYIIETWSEAGFDVQRLPYEIGKREIANIEVIVPGAEGTDQNVVVGAHYDSVGQNCPGANDNASGVAAVLALAIHLKNSSPAVNIRFVAFVNEEPPYFKTEMMGSNVYARETTQTVTSMISVETIGYYSDEPGSQSYPPPFSFFYPAEGNFVGFVGNLSSRSLVRRALRSFRASQKFPSEGIAAPGFVPGISWSDHWSFYKQGIPALMVTDTAPFRYPHYHLESDTVDKLDFLRMARVVKGLEELVAELTGGETLSSGDEQVRGLATDKTDRSEANERYQGNQ